MMWDDRGISGCGDTHIAEMGVSGFEYTITGSSSSAVWRIDSGALGSVKLSHKELQRLTPAERAEYARYRSRHKRDQH